MGRKQVKNRCASKPYVRNANTQSGRISTHHKKFGILLAERSTLFHIRLSRAPVEAHNQYSELWLLPLALVTPIPYPCFAITWSKQL